MDESRRREIANQFVEKVSNGNMQFYYDSEMLKHSSEDFASDPIRYVADHAKFLTADDEHKPYKVFELDLNGKKLIGKLVDRNKIKQVTVSSKIIDDPLFEIKILEYLSRLDLPAAKPAGYVKTNGRTIIFYEKIEGLSSIDESVLETLPRGKEAFVAQAEAVVAALRLQYEAAGIRRKHWRLKDFVFEIDSEANIISTTPIDWEGTSIVDDSAISEKLRELNA